MSETEAGGEPKVASEGGLLTLNDEEKKKEELMRSKPRAPGDIPPNATGEFPWSKAPQADGEEEADYGEAADDEYVRTSSS